jgi:hypothetical protein
VSIAPIELGLTEHCQEAVQGLRGAILRVCHSLGINATVPREVVDRLQVDKNIAWKISHIVSSAELPEAVAHIPGPSGLRILLKAAESAGASVDAVEQLRGAVDEFQRMVELHTGDRATLDLVLANLGKNGSDRLERSRRRAFEGNSGVWGVQARVRTTTHFIAPNADNPEMLDLAMIGGLVDFMRLRPNLTWPLFHDRAYHDDGSRIEAQTIPIEPGGNPDVPLLIEEFCSGLLPEIKPICDERGVVYTLGEGPIGRQGIFSCFYGRIDRGVVSRYCTSLDQKGELTSVISVPVEYLLSDVIVHRDLVEVFNPEVVNYGRLNSHVDGHITPMVPSLIPVHETVSSIGSGPPVCATPLVARYEGMIDRAFVGAGWSPRDFEGFRLVMKYPPLPSTVVLRFQLPQR